MAGDGTSNTSGFVGTDPAVVNGIDTGTANLNPAAGQPDNMTTTTQSFADPATVTTTTTTVEPNFVSSDTAPPTPNTVDVAGANISSTGGAQDFASTATDHTADLKGKNTRTTSSTIPDLEVKFTPKAQPTPKAAPSQMAAQGTKIQGTVFKDVNTAAIKEQLMADAQADGKGAVSARRMAYHLLTNAEVQSHLLSQTKKVDGKEVPAFTKDDIALALNSLALNEVNAKKRDHGFIPAPKKDEQKTQVQDQDHIPFAAIHREGREGKDGFDRTVEAAATIAMKEKRALTTSDLLQGFLKQMDRNFDSLTELEEAGITFKNAFSKAHEEAKARSDRHENEAMDKLGSAIGAGIVKAQETQKAKEAEAASSQGVGAKKFTQTIGNTTAPQYTVSHTGR